MSITPLQILKKTATLARRLPQYNFREYFGRKAKQDVELCKAGRYEGDAQAAYDQMRRMVSVHSLFDTEKLVIENVLDKKENKRSKK